MGYTGFSGCIIEWGCGWAFPVWGLRINIILHSFILISKCRIGSNLNIIISRNKRRDIADHRRVQTFTSTEISIIRAPTTLFQRIIKENIRDRTTHTFRPIIVRDRNIADLRLIILLQCCGDGLILFDWIGQVDDIGGVQVCEGVDWFLAEFAYGVVGVAADLAFEGLDVEVLACVAGEALFVIGVLGG